jgi:hypothetical protein
MRNTERSNLPCQSGGWIIKDFADVNTDSREQTIWILAKIEQRRTPNGCTAQE